MNIKKIIFSLSAIIINGIIWYAFANTGPNSFITPDEWKHYSGDVYISRNIATDASNYKIYLTNFENITEKLTDTNNTWVTLNSSEKSDGIYILTGESCNISWCTNFDTWVSFIIDNTPPNITLSWENPQYIEAKTSYIELWATATDDIDWDITSKINIDTGFININTLWIYTWKYNVFDLAGNFATEVLRTVIVQDTTKPIIYLIWSQNITIEAWTTYIDSWATATDNYDWDITNNILTDGSINIMIPWTYTISYNVSDSSNNIADEIIRNIKIEDTTPPVIKLIWDSTIYVEFWEEYTELWATWSDTVDGTWAVTTIVWSVNTGVIWTYNIEYSHTDSSNNVWSGSRTVIVQDTTPPQMNFSDAVNPWPTQSDTISIYRDDAIIKKRKYNNDKDCSTYTWDYPNDYAWELIETTEANNWKYFCFYGEDQAGNKTTLASNNSLNIDITPPTYSWVTEWAYYSHDITINYNDVNISGATLNGLWFNDWDPVVLEKTYILIIEDKAENTSTVNFTIDKTKPTIWWFTDMWYHNTNITISCSDTNLSGATVNWNPFNCGNAISDEWSYSVFVEDLAGNYSTWQFTIDKTPPTANISYNPSGPNWTNENVIATIGWFNEEVKNINNNSYEFTDNGNFEFTFEDLAENVGGATATVNRIDKSLPTVEQAQIYSGNINTWDNWLSGFYNGTINIRAKVEDNGWAWINTGSCLYTINWIDQLSANYNNWYCYFDNLDPQTNINISFSIKDIAGNVWTWINQPYFYDNIAPITTDNANSTITNIDQNIDLISSDTWVGNLHTLYCVDTNWSCIPHITGNVVLVTGNNGEVTQKYIRYNSIDKLNNKEEIKTSSIINIDKELPYITWNNIQITSSNSNWLFAKKDDTIIISFNSHETLIENPIVNISWWGAMTFEPESLYTYSRKMSSSDPEGKIFINISMKDLAGNVWNYTLASNIIYDRTPPSWISITEPNYSSYRQSQTWTAYREIKRSTWTEQNFWPTSLRIEYSNNNFQWWWVHTIITTWTSNNWVFHRTVNSDDTSSAQIRIIATDLAGNTRTFTSSWFKIDSIPPTGPEFIYPKGSEFFKWVNQINIQWTWWWDANLDKKILEFSINEGSNRTVLETLWDAAFSYIRTPWNINSNKVRLWIKYQDKWGLTSPYTQTQNFTIDSTPPTLIVLDNNNNRRNTNAIATWTSSDELAWLRNTGILYKTDWPFTTNCDGWSITIPVFTTDWIHTWYACVMDKVWNIRTWQQVYKIDKTAPIVHMPAPIITNTWKTININVNWDVSWIQSYKWSKISGSWTITFSTGTHVKDPFVTADTDWHYVLQVVVKDNATNTTTWTIDFFWNATAPIITTWTITNTSSKTPTFTFTATDSGTLYWSWPCSSSITKAVSGNNQITLSALANNTYNNCYVRIIDTMNNTWVWYNLPSFTVSYNPPSWWGGGGGGWWWGGWGFSIPTCTTQDLTCGIYGKYVLKSWVTCKWWDLWKSCGTDICVDWDYSWDPNDWICHDPTKVEANSWLTQSGTRETFKSPYNKELTDAYSYAFGVKITTVPNIERADLTGVLIRSHLSKMMSEYAMKVLWKTPDTSRKCIFKDVDNQTDEFKKYARISCELWLMWLKTDWTPADTFHPDGKVTRAIFGTTLSRAIWWDKNNWWSNWYAKHLADLKAHWIMNQIDFPNNRELRWRVMLTMMRADQKLKQSKYSKFESLWNKKIFVPAKTKATKPSTNNNAENKITEKYSSSDKEFINRTNKNYQFYEWYTIWQSKLWVKYLQYFLKEQDYYTWSIDWINNTATVSALLEFQLKHKLITDSNDMAAWFLWPSTRAVINPLLKEILNK